MIILNGVVHSQLDLRKWIVKERIVGHWCGVCHKASDAKFRTARVKEVL